MKWPWVRTQDERVEDLNETERVKARLHMVMDELRQTLNEAEEQLEKGIKP